MQPTYPTPPAAPAPAPANPNRWFPSWAQVIAWVLLVLSLAPLGIGALFTVSDDAQSSDPWAGLGRFLGWLVTAWTLAVDVWWVLFLFIRRQWLFAVAVVVTVLMVGYPMAAVMWSWYGH